MDVSHLKKRLPEIVVLVALIGVGAWFFLWPKGEQSGLVKGNGRIEATEIDVATKIAGRLRDVLVDEGDFVEKSQVLANIQSDSLQAQLAEAEAQYRQALDAVSSARAAIAARKSDKAAAEAVVAARQAEATARKQRLGRTETLTKQKVLEQQTLDDDRAAAQSSEAAVSAARAQVAAAEAAIQVAEAQEKGAVSTSEAAQATIARIKADVDECALRAPRSGRVQYRVTQVGEVLGVGGKVLNMVDLADVYLTFFLPEKSAGSVAMGSDVRLILDAFPEYVIPAKVSFVSSVAQFTPKTVETATERQKLMFRLKAQIDRELLQKHLKRVKTGLPGVAWLKLDAKSEWPADLAVKVPQ